MGEASPDQPQLRCVELQPEAMPTSIPRPPFYLTITFWVIVMNFTSSVGVVFLNKWLFLYYGFSSYTTVLCHFTFTTIGLFICYLFGVFTLKKLPILPMLFLSMLFCGFVVLTNLSLSYNSVGFYQVCKILTTPAVIMLQKFFFNKTHSTPVKLSMAIICCGTIVATYSEIRTSVVGTTIAFAGVVVASLYQILVGTNQTDYAANSMQLLAYQSPLSVVLLSLATPWLPEDEGTTIAVQDLDIFDPYFLTTLFFSCTTAFMVTLSTFLLIGRTSPLTYNAVGHGKLIVILIGGVVVFHSPVLWNNVVGVILTFAGLFWYTDITIKESEKKASAAPRK